ncbi:MAG TPA: M56 family metallopeptidase, partial [Urbifossiella sp.]
MVVVEAMLVNAAIAAGLALLALLIGYLCRRPSIVHAAWLIVLLKLVMPPLIAVPFTILPASWAMSNSEPSIDERIVFASAESAITSISGATNSTEARRFMPAGPGEWSLWLWAAGSFAWFTWQGRRILRFRRRVARAEAADAEIVEATVRLAAKLDIANPPAVKISTGIGSPMLWGWGRDAVILFPLELLPRLSGEARDTLIAHELAHFLRCDHWVRMLEFAATGLYWWHPAVWLARQGIECAEEECCDAWVVGGLAASPRRYAEALLATVDFEAELRRPCLPPAACAANRGARLLRRRLFGIINATRPRKRRGGAILWLLIAVVLLARPVPRAASIEVTRPATEPLATRTEKLSKMPPLLATPKRINELRSWASATAPGSSIQVDARDRDLVLTHPDGTTKVLGPGRPLALSFSSGIPHIATAGPGPLVRTWDDHGNPLTETRLSVATRSIAFTPDGSRLLVLDAKGGITVHDPQSLSVVQRW